MSNIKTSIQKAEHLKKKFGPQALDVAKEVQDLALYVNRQGDFPNINSIWDNVVLILTDV